MEKFPFQEVKFKPLFDNSKRSALRRSRERIFIKSTSRSSIYDYSAFHHDEIWNDSFLDVIRETVMPFLKSGYHPSTLALGKLHSEPNSSKRNKNDKTTLKKEWKPKKNKCGKRYVLKKLKKQEEYSKNFRFSHDWPTELSSLYFSIPLYGLFSTFIIIILVY